MSADSYSNAIRRALIPADQAEALAQIPGWGLAQYGDDFTPLDAEEDTVPVEQADPGVQQEDVSGLKEPLEDEIQATGGFLDLQEPARFTSPQDEELDSPSRTDSYNEAFEGGTEEAAPIESQPPAAESAAFAPDTRFNEFQPMTQDPGFDSLLPFLAETAPQGLTQEEGDDPAPVDEPENAAEVVNRTLEQSVPENEDKVEATEEAVQQAEESRAKEKEQEGGLAKEAKAAEKLSMKEEPGPVAEEQREEEDEEVFQDAVAEPASSQETASRLGRNRERKKAVNGSKSGMSGDVLSKKRPAPADAPDSRRPSARTAAISKRVHAAAKAAEAARESSARMGTSSAFTAATALSKNVAPLSDSTQHARPTTRSGKIGTAVSHALTSGGQTAEAGNESAELPKLADRKLPEAGKGAVEESTLRETRSRKKAAEAEAERPEGPAGQAPEFAGVTSQPNVDVSPYNRSASEGPAGPATETTGATLQPNIDVNPYSRSVLEGPAGPATDAAEVTLQPNTDADEARGEPLADEARSERGDMAVSEVDPAEGGGTESAVQGARDEPEEAGTAEAEADVPSEAPEKHGVDVSLEGATGGQEATGSGAEAPERNADGAAVDIGKRLRPESEAAAPRTEQSDGENALRSQENEELPDDVGAHPRLEKQSEATMQHRDGANGAVHSEEAADEQDEDTVSAEAHGDPRKAWQILEGTVQGDSLKRRLPEMTISEFRTRQSFPSDFVELVSLWPRKELKQQPVSLLTMSVDAGIWSPPPFYRGKRPRLR